MNARITQRGFKPSARGPAQVLGDLESAVIEVLWQRPGQSVTEVEAALRYRRDIAHTTVLTTLDRMFHKGYLTRQKRGRAFIYWPRYTAEEFRRGMAQEVLSGLLGHLSDPAISAFVDLVGDDAGALDRLEAVIREKRRRLAPNRADPEKARA